MINTILLDSAFFIMTSFLSGEISLASSQDVAAAQMKDTGRFVITFYIKYAKVVRRLKVFSQKIFFRNNEQFINLKDFLNPC